MPAGWSAASRFQKAMENMLLAYGQNGEMIRPSQGYPLRLITPGWEGNTNVKWLHSLKLTNQAYMARDETSKYSDLMPDGKARIFTYQMEAKSVITFPVRRAGAAGDRSLRVDRPRVVRKRKDRARRSHNRWRTELDGRAAAGTAVADRVDAFPDAVAFRRPRSRRSPRAPSTRPATCSPRAKRSSPCAAGIRSITSTGRSSGECRPMGR